MRATAGAWNFGLCATRSREPRQARKGATVPGMPRVPQITRSSSRLEKLWSPKLGAVRSGVRKLRGSGGIEGSQHLIVGNSGVFVLLLEVKP